MSKRYTTWGSIRSDCGHEHRTLTAAYRCLRDDQRGCALQGGYSDRMVRVLDDEHTHDEYDTTQGPGRTLTGDEFDELSDIMYREEAVT